MYVIRNLRTYMKMWAQFFFTSLSYSRRKQEPEAYQSYILLLLVYVVRQIFTGMYDNLQIHILYCLVYFNILDTDVFPRGSSNVGCHLSTAVYIYADKLGSYNNLLQLIVKFCR